MADDHGGDEVREQPVARQRDPIEDIFHREGAALVVLGFTELLDRFLGVSIELRVDRTHPGGPGAEGRNGEDDSLPADDAAAPGRGILNTRWPLHRRNIIVGLTRQSLTTIKDANGPACNTLPQRSHLPTCSPLSLAQFHRNCLPVLHRQSYLPTCSPPPSLAQSITQPTCSPPSLYYHGRDCLFSTVFSTNNLPVLHRLYHHGRDGAVVEASRTVSRDREAAENVAQTDRVEDLAPVVLPVFGQTEQLAPVGLVFLEHSSGLFVHRFFVEIGDGFSVLHQLLPLCIRFVSEIRDVLGGRFEKFYSNFSHCVSE